MRSLPVTALLALSLLVLGCSDPSPALETPLASPTPTSAPTVEPSPTSPATATATATVRPRRLQPGELRLAAEKDAIPAIFAEDDLFVDVEAGSEEWTDEEAVVGIAIDGDARAYPVRLLSLHEVVNDVVAGRALAITWCPLCFSAVVFDRVVEGRELTFGVSGYLYRNNLVMYDHQSNSLWSQLLGQGLKGAHHRQHLQILPSLMTTWGEWKAAHPDTRVLSAERMGKRAQDVVDPYAGYYAGGAAGLVGQDEADDRLKAKELVVGLRVGAATRAYPLATIRDEGLINDRLGTTPLLLVHDRSLQAVRVYRREIDGNVLTFQPGSQPGTLRDEESGSLWQIDTGSALDGPHAGARLERLAAPLVFWFAWSDLYPDTELYRP